MKIQSCWRYKMAKSNRKQLDLFGNEQKLQIAPLSRIRKVEEEIKKRKRLERKAINKIKHKVE